MAKRYSCLNGVKTWISGVLQPSQWGGGYLGEIKKLSIPLTLLSNSFLSNRIKTCLVYVRLHKKSTI